MMMIQELLFRGSITPWQDKTGYEIIVMHFVIFQEGIEEGTEDSNAP
jgi:hypothetical protein